MECMRQLNKFVDFVQKNYRNLQYLSQITPQIAHHYLKYEQGRGIAPKTYNDILKLLHSALSNYEKTDKILLRKFQRKNQKRSFESLIPKKNYSRF